MNLKTIAYLIILIIALSACSDDENILGGSLLPSADIVQVSYTNTIPVEAYSYIPDSIRTDAGEFLLLGGYRVIENELAGGANADIALVFAKNRIDTLIFDSKYDVTLESVFLHLYNRGFWGDSFGLNLVNVYELSEKLYNDSVYFSNQNPLNLYNESDLIGKLDFEPVDYSVTDSIRKAVTYISKLTIPLHNQIGERIIENSEALHTNNLKFDDIFKGVYVRSMIGEKTIMRIYPYDTKYVTNLQVVCKTKYDKVVKDSLGKEFVSEFGRDTIVYAHFSCTPETPRLNVFRQINGTYDFNGGKTQEKLLVKGMAGANLRIALPPLFSHSEFAPLPGDDTARIAVNNAKIKLTINREQSFLNKYPAPVNIRLRRNIPGGGLVIGPDEADYILAQSQRSYFSGLLLQNYTYEFVITEFVQELINKRTLQPDELVLLIADNRYTPSFTIFNGVSAPENPLELEIVYTRY